MSKPEAEPATAADTATRANPAKYTERGAAPAIGNRTREPVLTGVRLKVRKWHTWPPPTYEDRRGGPYFGVFGGVGAGGGTRGGGGFGLGF